MVKQIKENFEKKFRVCVGSLKKAVSTKDGEWVIKGFIDTSKRIYTVSADTKVVSKIMELLIFPEITKFANDNNLQLILTAHQNHYPDITFKDESGNLFAVDIKSTYRKNSRSVNGMTLGAFTGYFRNRESTKNIPYPYKDYAGHYVLGLIYTRSDEDIDETTSYSIDDLSKIKSVVTDSEFFLAEKFKIAIDRPGSGNTKNIGGITLIEDLVNGKGPFSVLGEHVFDDYWTNYLTTDMAKKEGHKEQPYKNLKTYAEYKKNQKK
ncbi:MAG: restriction endonuclease [Halobacteriovoraceae bacterium]|jgi:hypothetical protein|nr:restriction endonuclease [Halobacteriovoraceae bacterium]